MDWAQHFLDQYGYWAVFVWTFIEGESVFILAAALAAVGLMEPAKVIAAAAVGAFVGHLVFFGLGRWRGVQVIQAVPMLRKHYPKAKALLDKYLDRHGNWTIFLFQYLYGTRVVAAILFGCSSIGFWRFVFLQILNCISWAVIIYTAGHLLGLGAHAVIRRFGLLGLAIGLSVLLLAAVWAYIRYGHARVKGNLKG